MLFNSIEFAVFLPIVFVLYWFFTNHNLKLQNLLIVAASYLFYGWWDWRFLSLVLFSTVLDYSVSLGLFRLKDPAKRRMLFACSMIVNLGFLGVFKYYNFFVDSFISAFSFFGYEFSARTLNVILPVGISFYTFQTMSYTIDVYKGKLAPTKDFIAFCAFVSFFPQLVAGPIERATNLLPQFFRHRTFDYGRAVDGMRQILWGLFKKIAIADNCAEYVNTVFSNSAHYSGSTLLMAAVLFAFQIYCDFSGYSDVAIGTARLFGFDLMRNFAFPYFSRDIAEFWRRWHISLSTWFRDYVYIPLGGSRGGTWMKIRNTFIIFLLSGFWHGANWTFLLWGFVNALYFLPLLLSRTNRNNIDVVSSGRYFPTIREALAMLTTFSLTVLAWIFFRSQSIGQAWDVLSAIFSRSLFTVPEVNPGVTTVLLLAFIAIEWLGRERQYAIEAIGSSRLRYAGYYMLIVAILYYSSNQQAFIYFQF